MEYKEKYLKYKKKYISLSNELKNSMTGGTMGEYSTLSNNKKNIKIAVCTLNQWVLDFENNELKIFSAIDIAYNNGAKIVLLPELVSCGYSCEDHFYEREVYFYSFNIIKKILPYSNNKDIRLLYKTSDYRQVDLAKKYDVSISVIANIIHNRTYVD